MFYGLDDKHQKILQNALGIIGNLFGRVFHADHLITVDRCMGFFDDEEFMSSLESSARTPQNKSIVWRLHTLSWAMEQALDLPGDLVECGVFEGFCSDFLSQYLSLADKGKQFYLYDTFEGFPDEQLKNSSAQVGSYKTAGLYESVLARFENAPHVQVVKGVVPNIFDEIVPERVCFLHLDMNSAVAEVGALEVLFERVVPGGLIVLDDYGWQVYRAQKDAEDIFFSKHNYKVLELPTGQGLVIKRP